MPGRMTLFVDGAARGNPGPAGIAAILLDEVGREVFVEKAYIGEATNNSAEYQALILGLRKAVGLADAIKVCSDSELVVRQLNGDYKVKKSELKALVGTVTVLMARFGSVEVTHVPRERNARADEEANSAIDEFESGTSESAHDTLSEQGRLFDV